jgi:hypothetical protein
MFLIPASYRRFLFSVLILAGGMAWLCSVRAGKSWLDAICSLPPYRISLHGLPTAAQVSAQDGISLPGSAMLEVLIQPLAPVRGPVRIAPYFVSDDQTLQPWPVQLASYDQGSFILRARVSSLPEMTRANNHLIFIAYRSSLQAELGDFLIEALPHSSIAAEVMITALYGQMLHAEVQVLPASKNH